MTLSPDRICIALIGAIIVTALIIAWPYPDVVASAIGLLAGLTAGVLSGGRSA